MSRPRALRRKICRDRACSGDSPGDRRARPKPSPTICGRAEDDGAAWIVVDDLPKIPPVTRAEIDVIETWFADLLDEILGRR
ncbi:hypothetical protein [Rhodoblastus sp.]|uniref:hypothetical protein n=1 Tax=Rhodoblastus sp. TaxID=1962975 RepID=UPI00261C89CF|nr:hypothetical protein [Rhodoblastus sp.]